jgi:pimeloyl-ACP methyl ester carboxylesterase
MSSVAGKMVLLGVAVLATGLLVCACGGNGTTTAASPAKPLLAASANKKCVLSLHGKGAAGMPASTTGDIEYLRPGGNDTAWGGREWRYFPQGRYEELRGSLSAALDAAGCGRVIVQGFSNGAAAAAKLYCTGETFGGRVVGYIADDPVPDAGVVGCKPHPGMHIRLYWTGALSAATDGWSCATQDWTCEGGQTIGIERYARELGTAAAPSIHSTHMEYTTPPEVAAWLD